MKNYFMIRLVGNRGDLLSLFDKNSHLKFFVNAVQDETTIGRGEVTFKLAKLNELKIRIENSVEGRRLLEIEENYNYNSNDDQCDNSNGIYLDRIEGSVSHSTIFQSPLQKEEEEEDDGGDSLFYSSTHLRYSIVDTNVDGLVDIDEYSGHLTVKCGLDREDSSLLSSSSLSSPIIHLNISIRDEKHLFETAYLLFDLIILDVNDNPPTFRKEKFTKSIEINRDNWQSPFQLVFDEIAIDVDAGENSSLTYELYNVNDDHKKAVVSLFHIESATGRVSIQNKCIISDKLIKKFDLTILCKDNGRPQFHFTLVNLELNVDYTGCTIEKVIHLICIKNKMFLSFHLNIQTLKNSKKAVYLFEFDSSLLNALGTLKIGQIIDKQSIINNQNQSKNVEVMESGHICSLLDKSYHLIIAKRDEINRLVTSLFLTLKTENNNQIEDESSLPLTPMCVNFFEKQFINNNININVYFKDINKLLRNDDYFSFDESTYFLQTSEHFGPQRQWFNVKNKNIFETFMKTNCSGNLIDYQIINEV
jgi:hypothetical protein